MASLKDIDGIWRLTKPFVGLAERKGRFRTLLSVTSNFATLNPFTEVMQRSVYVGVLYYDDNTTRRGLACVAYP